MENLTIRQMQAWAAACVWEYSAAFEIKHHAVLEMVRHQMAMLDSCDLPKWESTGAQLTIPGRGDPVPPDVLACVPREIHNQFTQLVDDATEVGIVDMHGASTGRPWLYLTDCFGALKRARISIPEKTPLVSINSDKKDGSVNHVWGTAIGGNRKARIMSQHGIPEN